MANTGGVTYAGLAIETALLAGVANQGLPKYVGWGTGTTAFDPSQTALANEVDVWGGVITNTDRGQGGTLSQVTTTTTNDTLQLVQTITAMNYINITEIGVFDSPGLGQQEHGPFGGNMLARFVLDNAISVIPNSVVKFVVNITKVTNAQ